jgi:hypothetical protein
MTHIVTAANNGKKWQWFLFAQIDWKISPEKSEAARGRPHSSRMVADDRYQFVHLSSRQ